MAPENTDAHGRAEAITAHNPFSGNRLGFDARSVVDACVEGRTVIVTYADSTRNTFHHQWLRHSCYSEVSGNPADGIRFTTAISFDSDIAPTSVAALDGDLAIVWNDGHTSLFGSDWLRHHAYDTAGRARRASWRPTTWRAELADHFPTVSSEDACDGGEGQLRLYRTLLDYGIVRVSGLGTEPEQTEVLANLLGPIHETTVYGYIYDVRAEPVAKLGAKTGMPQAPHIDDAFAYSPPGIDVFHCLHNTDIGGMSTYVDGFAIAESIRAEAPEAHELLTTVPIQHIRRHPDEIDLRFRGPLISLDEWGNTRGIRYFDRAMAPLDVDPDLVEPMYDAIREYNRRMVDPAFVAEIRVSPGDGMLIDNHRVMHGRTAFDPSSGRHIRLCHVPRDEFHGRWRELARRLAPADHDLHLPQGSLT